MFSQECQKFCPREGVSAQRNAGIHPPPLPRALWDIVNKQAVRILLECIHVDSFVSLSTVATNCINTRYLIAIICIYVPIYQTRVSLMAHLHWTRIQIPNPMARISIPYFYVGVHLWTASRLQNQWSKSCLDVKAHSLCLVAGVMKHYLDGSTGTVVVKTGLEAVQRITRYGTEIWVLSPYPRKWQRKWLIQ